MQNSNESNTNTIKVGRFAPSPTGSLHFGSLIAAVASYLCARQHPQSQWLLRIEDVDIERKIKGATSSIIKSLEVYGFQWDRDIVYQSQRSEYYQTALVSISKNVYPCSCTRKDLQKLSSEMLYGYNYPGLCRKDIQNKEVSSPSIRVLTNNEEVYFQDTCQTQSFCQNIETDVGDFILKRRGALFAYQLAVVVDDHLQGINQVVRGADLFDNTPRQIYLQRLLGYTTPEYLHFPVATTVNGKKLSKQNHSPEITLENKAMMLKTLLNALAFLGQNPPESSDFSNIDDIWLWAIHHWNSDLIPKTMNVVYDNSTISI
jgi:glutamyl-Q tRNA(Asp) synthetase